MHLSSYQIRNCDHSLPRPSGRLSAARSVTSNIASNGALYSAVEPSSRPYPYTTSRVTAYATTAMSSFRKLKSYVTGGASDLADELKDAAIPVSDASCRGCVDPCDEGAWRHARRGAVDRV